MNTQLANNTTVYEAIVENYKTPVFLYNEKILEQQYEKIRHSLPAGVELYYSMKANPNPTICSTITKWGSPIEVASLGEYKSALAVGVNPNVIIFTGPGKRREEITYCLKQGIYALNAESFQEIESINEEARKINVIAPLMVRVNVSIQTRGSRMISAGISSQFGIDEEEIFEAVELIRNLEHLKFIGLHTYQGTQNFNLDSHMESIERMFGISKKLIQQDIHVEALGLGGGFGVPVFMEDTPFLMKEYGELLREMLGEFQAMNISKIFVESGRYIVSEMGEYMTSVLYTKVSHGKHYAILDGGTHHRAFSSLMGRSFKQPLPIKYFCHGETIISHEDNGRIPYTLVGNLCTPTDVIQSNVWLPELKPGDIIIFQNSGAYGLTCGNVHFLSHDLPRELFLHEDEKITDISWLK